MTEPYWYRLVGRKYHQERADWVRSGLAVCGADIRRPAYAARTLTEAKGDHGPGVCKTCEKKARAA